MVVQRVWWFGKNGDAKDSFPSASKTTTVWWTMQPGTIAASTILFDIPLKT